MSEYKCVSCDTTFIMDESPDYCPGCGNPKNQKFGTSVARSNPNITGFIPVSE